MGYLVDAVIDRSVKGSLMFVGKQSSSICALDMKCEMFCALLDLPTGITDGAVFASNSPANRCVPFLELLVITLPAMHRKTRQVNRQAKGAGSSFWGAA